MIPWVGDVIQINPKIDLNNPQYACIKNMNCKGDKLSVKSVTVQTDDPLYISVEVNNYRSFGIYVPNGSFYKDNKKADSLFVLISGRDKEEFKKGSRYPVPIPGDKITISNINNGDHIIKSCNCYNEKEKGWPFTADCGAHLDGRLSGLCYNVINVIMGGWVYNGILHRTAQSISVVKQSDLKSLNTKLGVTACASCGGKLRNPLPGNPLFQHCPKCEP